MTKKKQIKKQDPHTYTKIPEDITIEQLEAQTTVEIPFQFVYELREAFKSWNFKVGNIVVKDKFEMWFDIEFDRYRKQSVVRSRDTIKIIAHQCADTNHYGQTVKYYFPLLKGELRIKTLNLQSIMHVYISKISVYHEAAVDYFSNNINSGNHSDFWTTHFEELKKQGVYKQDWRLAKMTNEWIESQDYHTMPNPHGYKTWKSFEDILSDYKRHK